MTIWDYADECGNVRLADLAREAGVDKRTAAKWLDAGLVPYRRLPLSGQIRLKAPDVERFLAGLRLQQP